MKRYIAMVVSCAVFIGVSLVAQVRLGEQEDDVVRAKMAVVEKFVNDAAAFFSEVTLAEAMRGFEKDSRWHAGELEMNVFDVAGNCYLFGSLLGVLWENFKDVPKTAKVRGMRGSILGTDFVGDMAKKAEEGGGWISFDWMYENIYAYVTSVTKNGVKYLLSAGFYPDSERFQLRQMIKNAIRYGDRKGAQALFAQINNPAGEFVEGDFYLWAYDLEGNCFAHGSNLAMVGQNLINFKDSRGFERNKVMVDLVKKHGSGWIEYHEDGLVKNAYVEQFKDPRTGKVYIVGGGNYPTITKDSVMSFVKRAVEYLKAQGSTVALRDFTSHAGGFIKGPLRIMVLNLEGEVLADAYNPIFIGQNLMNRHDPEGKYFIREIIEQAKAKGRGWLSYLEKGAYKAMYAEYVETPDGKYVIMSGFWPGSKEYSAETLLEKAFVQISRSDIIESLRLFTTMSADYIYGDLFVQVYTDDGICLAYGLDRDRIWFDEKKVLDDKGMPIINRLLNAAKKGGGWVEYEKNGARYKVCSKQVTRQITEDAESKIKAASAEVDETKRSARVTKKETRKKESITQTFVVAVGYYI